jgi:hypothetical protein
MPITIKNTAGGGVTLDSTTSSNETLQLPSGGGTLVRTASPSFTGDSTITSGNLIFATASKGVYLGVTSATAANLLNDYEIGSWNPTLASSGGTDSGRTYSATPVGTYVKVGKLVTLTFEIACDAAGTLGSGEAVIKGIPFTPDQKGSGTFAKASAFAAAKNAVSLSVETNNVKVYLMQSASESTTVLGYIAPSGWGTPSVWGTMTYTTAA